MIKGALSSLFRPTSTLDNEPTVDYNHTLRTNFGTENESTIDSKIPPMEGPEWETNYRDQFSNLIDDESDEELNKDIEPIIDNLTMTSERLARTGNNSTLPHNYPGKMIPPTPKSQAGQSETGNDVSIQRKIEELQQEIERDGIAARNDRSEIFFDKKAHQHELRGLIDKVESQNEFLKELSTLVEFEEHQQIPTNYEKMYNDLKKEYIQELTTHRGFYEAYYRLVLKYRGLKSSKKPSPSTLSIREKVRSIKSMTTQPSIKATCDNILRDLSAGGNLDQNYKEELDKANIRIKELESELAKT